MEEEADRGYQVWSMCLDRFFEWLREEQEEQEEFLAVSNPSVSFYDVYLC